MFRSTKSTLEYPGSQCDAKWENRQRTHTHIRTHTHTFLNQKENCRPREKRKRQQRKNEQKKCTPNITLALSLSLTHILYITQVVIRGSAGNLIPFTAAEERLCRSICQMAREDMNGGFLFEHAVKTVYRKQVTKINEKNKTKQGKRSAVYFPCKRQRKKREKGNKNDTEDLLTHHDIYASIYPCEPQRSRWSSVYLSRSTCPSQLSWTLSSSQLSFSSSVRELLFILWIIMGLCDVYRRIPPSKTPSG